MEHYHGYYILRDVEHANYIVDTEEYGLQPTWDLWKATRFDCVDDAIDFATDYGQDGYHLEILFVEININEVRESTMGNRAVINSYGKVVDYKLAVSFMDDEIREQLHADLVPCSNQDFFNAYAKRHKDTFDEEWIADSENPMW